MTPKQRPWLGQHWDKLMTNDLYIFKPNTEFTTKWYNTLLSIMDVKFNNETTITRYKSLLYNKIKVDMKNLIELKDKLISNEKCKFTIFPSLEFIEKVAFYKQGGYGNEYSSEIDHSLEY